MSSQVELTNSLGDGNISITYDSDSNFEVTVSNEQQSIVLSNIEAFEVDELLFKLRRVLRIAEYDLMTSEGIEEDEL